MALTKRARHHLLQMMRSQKQRRKRKATDRDLMTTTTAVESRVITMLTYLLNKRFFIQSSLRSCNKKRKSKSLEPRVSYHQWVNR